LEVWGKNKMKILILNYEFPPLGGGAGNTTKYISRELAKMGHSVTTITTWFSGLKEDEIVDGYRLIRLRAIRKRKDRSNVLEMFHYVFLAAKTAKHLVKNEKPDHVISFFAMPTGLIAWYLKRKFALPYTLSLQGGDVPGFLPKNLGTLHRLTAPLTKLVWRHADNIVANSDGLKELAEQTAKPLGKEVVCIPNGVDNAIFYPKENPTSPFKILFVGRLVEQKGITFLLKSLAQIKKRYANAYDQIETTIIGDGPLRGTLENETDELDIRAKVKFLGWIDRDVLPQIYRESSVFIMPSLEEGMPNVVLEAMASGLPIISTDNRGTNELVKNGENGIIIKDHSVLSSAILELIHDPNKRTNYAKSSRKLTEARGWDILARSYLELI
jgi:glycosyltransferase involved in cell wall biosynthesis